MGRFIFVTGGVRSGKSAFAEHYAQQLAKGQPLTYIASGVAFDAEMQARIARHQADRAQSGNRWRTLEIPDDLPNEWLQMEKGAVVLWDCLTTWLGNVMYKTQDPTAHVQAFKTHMQTWRKQGVYAVLVSNELMDEAPSKYKETERYKKILGELHQWIVETCDEAYEIDHQLSKRWK